jgi:hypothetical protein
VAHFEEGPDSGQQSDDRHDDRLTVSTTRLNSKTIPIGFSIRSFRQDDVRQSWKKNPVEFWVLTSFLSG